MLYAGKLTHWVFYLAIHNGLWLACNDNNVVLSRRFSMPSSQARTRSHRKVLNMFELKKMTLGQVTPGQWTLMQEVFVVPVLSQKSADV